LWRRLAFLAAFLALALPYLAPLDCGSKLDVDIRWYLFMAATLPAIVVSLHGAPGALSGSLGLLLLLNAGLRLFSAAWSGLPPYTLRRGVSVTLLALFLLLTLRGALRSRAGYEKLLGLLAAIAALLFVPGALLALTGRSVVPWSGMPVFKGYGKRFCGILGNPNQVGICAAVLLPITFTMWLRSMRRGRYLLLTMVVVASLAASRSRAGLVASTVGLAAALGIWLGRRRFVVVSTALGLVLVTFGLIHEAPGREAARLYLRANPEGKPIAQLIQDAGESRLERWSLTLESIRKRPFVGQGYGVHGYGRTLPGGFDFGYAAHNSYLSILQENGILGLLLLAPLVVGTVRRVAREDRARGPRESRHLHAALGGAALGGLVNALFESWLFSVGNLATMPFWTCVVALWMLEAAPRRGAMPNPKSQVPTPRSEGVATPKMAPARA
jgi:O-antigen ligase